MKLVKFHLSIIALFSLIVLLGCQAYLAPNYDQAIFKGATENGEVAMRFFAALEYGTESENFYSREPIYNQLIGAFETLKLQAKARPTPNNNALKKINEHLQATGNDAITEDYPSAFAFGEIAETFRKMKKVDSENGIKPIVIQTFKGQVEIYLDQAITYESFLKR